MTRNLLDIVAVLVMISQIGCATQTVRDSSSSGGLEEQVETALSQTGNLEGIEFRRVHFEYRTSNWVDQSKEALDYNLELLKRNPTLLIQIEGHCDSRGSVELNFRLGEKRAKRIRDYLVKNGIDRSRISIISMGEGIPLQNIESESAFAMNRRAEFQVLAI